MKKKSKVPAPRKDSRGDADVALALMALSYLESPASLHEKLRRLPRGAKKPNADQQAGDWSDQ